ncbi:MAG TPA: hypothetical protein VNK23_09735 [Candidatus Dormibacteraeota bacterium]|nr:hypothetical protein [Candidatus Dormibacteraeota bacterium]
MRFELIRDLDDGERVFVSAYGSRIEAERQAQALNQLWPGIYVVRETPGPSQNSAVAPEQYARHLRP